MLYKKLLVAYDGSEPSRGALVAAKNMIGDDPGAEMYVVSIVSIGSLGLSGDVAASPLPGMQQIFPDMRAYDEAIANAKLIAQQNIETAIKDLASELKCKVTVDATVAVKPADGICEYAEDVGADMIVMGRRGLGAFRAMLGSVSYAVLQGASIPVVTVK